ncbi:MAG: ROK family protein [Gemmataceae bacterium]|nr:ROK family protein [Gemmataceae bacterium]MDW8266626.1 ROK family protein [Gemmataceae bacterium]
MKVLVIDVGGTHVKSRLMGQEEIRRFRSGPQLTASEMVHGVLETTRDWKYDAVSIGYPGPVVQNKILLEPRNLGRGWVGFDFAAHFGKPVKIINDAAMQALGSYEGGRMLFLGLGTGLGTAFIIDKVVAALELAHLPYKKGRSFEDYLGLRGLKRLGKKRWRRAVEDVVARLRAAFVADYVVLGGGNVKKLATLPPGCKAGDNKKAFVGGERLWTDY